MITPLLFMATCSCTCASHACMVWADLSLAQPVSLYNPLIQTRRLHYIEFKACGSLLSIHVSRWSTTLI